MGQFAHASRRFSSLRVRGVSYCFRVEKSIQTSRSQPSQLKLVPRAALVFGRSLFVLEALVDQFLEGVRPWLDEYLTRAPAGTGRADHAKLVHQVDQARGAWIAEAQPPLDERGGGFALGDDQRDS